MVSINGLNNFFCQTSVKSYGKKFGKIIQSNKKNVNVKKLLIW